MRSHLVVSLCQLLSEGAVPDLVLALACTRPQDVCQCAEQPQAYSALLSYAQSIYTYVLLSKNTLRFRSLNPVEMIMVNAHNGTCTWARRGGRERVKL